MFLVEGTAYAVGLEARKLHQTEVSQLGSVGEEEYTDWKKEMFWDEVWEVSEGQTVQGL